MLQTMIFDLDPLIACGEKSRNLTNVEWINDRKAMDGHYYFLYTKKDFKLQVYSTQVYRIEQSMFDKKPTKETALVSIDTHNRSVDDIKAACDNPNKVKSFRDTAFSYLSGVECSFNNGKDFIPSSTRFWMSGKDNAPSIDIEGFPLKHEAEDEDSFFTSMSFFMNGEMKSYTIMFNDWPSYPTQSVAFYENGTIKSARNNVEKLNRAYQELQFNKEGNLSGIKPSLITVSDRNWGSNLQDIVTAQIEDVKKAAYEIHQVHGIIVSKPPNLTY